MAIDIDQYVCNEHVVCNGTVYLSGFLDNRGYLYDIRVTHQRIILSSKSYVQVWPLKRIVWVELCFNDRLNMWEIGFRLICETSCHYIYVSQFDWANTLFNNIQYYSVFN